MKDISFDFTIKPKIRKKVSSELKERYNTFINNELNVFHEDEEFKSIIFNDDYKISNYGKVINTKRNNKILKPCLDNRGYLKVTLRVDYKRKDCFIHKLVSKYFVSNPNNYNITDHIDGNVLNNYYKNLRFTTVYENTNNPNTSYRIREGILKSDRGNHKEVILIDKDNNIIKEFRSIRQAAKYFNINPTYVTNYLNNKILYNRQGNPYTIKHIKGYTLKYK